MLHCLLPCYLLQLGRSTEEKVKMAIEEGLLVTQQDREIALANRIERELCNGFRFFVLAGAELDWVIAALRRDYERGGPAK